MIEVPVALEPKIKREEAIEIVRRDIGSEHVVTIPRLRLMLFRDGEIHFPLKFPPKRLHLKASPEKASSGLAD